MKNLEKRSANLRGKGKNHRLSTPERLDQAEVLDLVRDDLEDSLYKGAGANDNLSTVLTPEVRQQLIDLHPDNPQWVKHVDTNIMKSTDLGQLRAAQKPFVNISQIIDEGADNGMTFGGRAGNNISANSIKDQVIGTAVQKGRGIIARGAAKMQMAGGEEVAKAPSLLGKFVRAGGAQVGTRAVAAPFTAEPAEAETMQPTAPVAGSTPPADFGAAGMTGMPGGAETGQTDYVAAAKQALAAGNYEAFNAIIKLSELEAAGAGGAADPLSTTAAKDIANAQAGLDSVQQMAGELQRDPNVLKKAALPGGGLFGGAGDAALGTGTYEAAKSQVVDVIARMRTGATISDSEAKRFESFIPQPFDPEPLRISKLQTLAQMFQTVANRQNTGVATAGAV
jgi:hypothetical protein